MNTEQLVTFLVGEIDELMGAGRVGLYEFFEVLRSDQRSLPYEEMLAVSEAALHRLLSSGLADLEWKVWADPSYSRRAVVADITEGSWATPTDDPYLAVEPK